MYRYQNSKHFWFEHFIHLLLIYFISYISSLYIIIFLLSLYHYIYKYIYSYLSIHYLSIHYIYLIHIYKICTDQNSKHFWFEHFIHLLLIYFISTLYIIIFYYHYITIRGCSKPSSRIYDIKNLVAFGHKNHGGLRPQKGGTVTSMMLWPLATTNCGGLRSQNSVYDFRKRYKKAWASFCQILHNTFLHGFRHPPTPCNMFLALGNR